MTEKPKLSHTDSSVEFVLARPLDNEKMRLQLPTLDEMLT